MKKCTELARFNGRSVIEIRRTDTDAVVQYVVCSNFNNSKMWGSKWDWGHYFDVWGGDTTEIQLRNAMMYLYGMDESEISFDRAKKLAKDLCVLCYVDNDGEYMTEFLKARNITEEEAEFLGVKDVIFPKKYKVVNVTFERKQRVTVKVVMPDDEDEFDAENYVDTNYLDSDANIDEDDWECDYYSIDRNDLSAEDYERMYDRDDIFNDSDFENL